MLKQSVQVGRSQTSSLTGQADCRQDGLRSVQGVNEVAAIPASGFPPVPFWKIGTERDKIAGKQSARNSDE